MPEATLGLGLAGGLSYTLPRLLGGNQPLALCLALTGMALEGPDLVLTQIATGYMTHRRLDMMMERLAEVIISVQACWVCKRVQYEGVPGLCFAAGDPGANRSSNDRVVCCCRIVRCPLYQQINQDPKPFGDKTPDCSEDPTAVQTLLERSVDLSWNVDGLPDDLLDPPESQIPITPFVHDLLPQVRAGAQHAQEARHDCFLTTRCVLHNPVALSIVILLCILRSFYRPAHPSRTLILDRYNVLMFSTVCRVDGFY